MTFTRRHIIGFIALASAAFAVPSAQASASLYTPQAASAPSYIQYVQNMISPSQAKSIAARRVPGAKFVDIARSGGKYRVRMLRKDGQVVDVLIDATTGRVLN